MSYMRKKFLLILLFFCILLTSCKDLLEHGFYVVPVDGENTDIYGRVYGDLYGLHAELVPDNSDEEGFHVYKEGDKFSIVLSGTLDFNKYDYYSLTSYFFDETSDLDFIDEGKGLINPGTYYKDGKTPISANFVNYIVKEGNCNSENKIKEHVYNYEEIIPIKAKAPCSNKLAGGASAKNDSQGFDSWGYSLRIKIISAD